MSGKKSRLVGISLFLTIVLGGACILWLNPWETAQPKGKPSRKRDLPELIAKAVEVLAITENGRDYRAAISGWSQLLEERPGDRDLLLNQAVTVLKWISETNSILASGSVTEPERLRVLAGELDEAFVQADQVLQELSESASTASKDSRQALLEAALMTAKARPYPDDVDLRKRAAEKLLDAAENNPQPLLASRLIDLSQELQADWPEVLPKTSEVVYQAWKKDARNLFLLVKAGNGLLDQKDLRVIELLDASIELSKPLMSTIPGGANIRPAELANEIRAALSTEDWAKGQRLMKQWLNLLLASSAFRADNRQVNPDILALINTSFLERWRGLLPPVAAKTPEQLNSHSIELPIAAQSDLLGWYDYDIDHRFEILSVKGSSLQIWASSSNFDPALLRSPNEAIEVHLPISPKGMCIVDMWSVDNPLRPRNVADADAPLDSRKHDTLQEVVLWNEMKAIVLTRDRDAKFAVLEDVSVLSELVGLLQLVPLDLDSDGDLDFAALTSGGVRLIQNNGNRTFRDISQHSVMPPTAWEPGRMVACDFDRDIDTDLVICSTSQPHMAVLENIQHNQFRFRALEGEHWNDIGPLTDIAVLDVDGNASWDWCGISDRKLYCLLTRTTAPGVVTALSLVQRDLPGEPAGVQSGQTLWVADLNLDGFVDISVDSPRGIHHFLGDGDTIAQNSIGSSGSIRAIQDADRDGRLDLLITANGQVRRVKITPMDESNAHFLEARIRGIADTNGGGLINHYAIGSVLELWSNGRYQARVIDSPVTHFGLGDHPADNLRIVFNNGLTQNAIKPDRDVLHDQIQELKGSCPFVYGWNGEHFELITDLLWNAPLGLQLAPGKVLPDRRWENLLLKGQFLQPRDGQIELRVTEELWEVAYFDHMSLSVVDHPSSIEVWTNEKVGPPDLAQPRLFLASRPIRPRAARDGHGRTVLETILKRDRKFVQAFERQLCQGLCEKHFLELEFDPKDLVGRNQINLVLTGWLYPTDTSLNIGISQNPDRQPPEPPSLWVANENGEFACAIPFMGFPGGKPKTIVVDLSDVFANYPETASSGRLRIASSQQIYWDEAYIAADEPPAPVRVEKLPLKSAELRFRGFSQLMPRAADQPHWYDYQQTSTVPRWPPLEGLFTRYGDVLPQMQYDDDHIVVMTSGDEMVLKFDLPIRPLPTGWCRDYVLHSVGWDKDADINTLEGQSSLPLPYRAMRSYPPPVEQLQESERVWITNADSLTRKSPFRKYWSARADW